MTTLTAGIETPSTKAKRPRQSLAFATAHLTGTGLLASVLFVGCAHAPRPQQPVTPATPATASAAPAEPPAPEPAPSAADPQQPPAYGSTPRVRTDANSQTASVAAALRDKHHPERLSPLIPPKPFDRATYDADRAAYLNTVEPGRVFQVAQPGAGVPRIEAIGATRANVVQGGSAVLRTRAPAGMPVTFLSTDLGRFQDNELTCVTVAANEQGIAQATFVGASGTLGEVRILAACPVTAGQVAFNVYITNP